MDEDTPNYPFGHSDHETQRLQLAVGRYELRALLGDGGFGTVYRAHDPSLDREVALKILHPHLARNAEIRRRFLREGRALARVRHPNIVAVYESGEVDDIPYLATELVEGRGLNDVLAAGGPLPLHQVLAIVEQVAAALTALHAHHLIHRDVKPANIMLESSTGRAVLLDLGIARDLTEVTQYSGWLIGSLSVLAPEQARRGGHVTAQTDVYQLGATTYTLLAGRAPFVGDHFTVLDAIKEDAPPDLRELRADLSPHVAAVLMKTLAKDPTLRPPGTQAFTTELQAAASGRAAPSRSDAVATIGASTPSEDTASVVPLDTLLPARGRSHEHGRGPGRWWLWAAVGTVVLAVLLIVGISVGRRERGTRLAGVTTTAAPISPQPDGTPSRETPGPSPSTSGVVASPAAAVPRTIRIVSPKNGATIGRSTMLEVEVSGIALKPAIERDPEAGHYDLLIDLDPDTIVVPGRPLPTGQAQVVHLSNRSFELPWISPGTHTLTVILVGGDHLPLAPLARDRIAVIVEGAP